ncbi:MAG: hypothetical protein AVDCRST_MAG93-8915, partial [uncultured Chloroflexia bacterium]
LVVRFIVLCVAIIAIGLIKQRRLAATGIFEIDKMEGIDFEKRLELLFRQLGYRVERTRARGDYGADLILAKDGVKTAVQAKRSKKAIGVKAVQEVGAAKNYYRCTAAMVVTNNVYTKQAQNPARANDIALWDRDRLVENLRFAGRSREAARVRGEGA